ncbi:MAG: hypothetical protein U5L11_07305 [Arhodomonas sp.]|nr:hypothetical protein [Arhodomonas sp.]
MLHFNSSYCLWAKRLERRPRRNWTKRLKAVLRNRVSSTHAGNIELLGAVLRQL